MGGLGKQGARKARQRSVLMSEEAEDPLAPRWERPHRDLCQEENYVIELPGQNLATDRLNIRLVVMTETWLMVEFALILMTLTRHQWVEVAELDSCHDRDVHLHQCGRAAEGRVGTAESLLDLSAIEEVQTGYDLGLTTMENRWQQLKERWHYA